MIDLRGQQNIRHSWSVDVETNTLALSFLADGDEPFGSVVIENNKTETLFNDLNESARAFFPDIDPSDNEGYRDEFIAFDKKGNILFDVLITPTPPPGSPATPIDLTGQDVVSQKWVPDGDDINIQFHNSDDLLLGEITIEGKKARSFFRALNTVRERAFGDGDPTQFKSRTVLNTVTGVSESNFIGLEYIPPADAPPFVTGVNVFGVAQIGETLTGNYSYGDVNGDLEGTSTFKWYRASNNLGVGKSEIIGEVTQSYTLQVADTGLFIGFEVTPVALTGTSPGTAVNDFTDTSVVPAEAVPIASNVNISGIPKELETLTGTYDYSDENGDPEGASTFIWYRADDAFGTNKVAIGGATNQTYDVVSADLGRFLSFEVTPVAISGDSIGLAAESPPTSAIAANNSPVASNVQMSGTLQEEETLTGSYDYSDSEGDIEGVSTFKWYKSDDISGTGKVQATVDTELLQQPSEKLRSTFVTEDANIATGSNVGTIGGSGAISGSKFVTNAAGYIDYPYVGNVNPNVGTVRFKFTPNFTGGPTANSCLFHQSLDGSGLGNNSIFLQWATTGGLALYVNNEVGTVLIFNSLAVFSAVSGVTNEWEIDYDFDGTTRIFIDGSLHGILGTPAAGPQTDTGAPGKIRLGAFRISPTGYIDGTYDDLQIFSTVQHTSNFTGEIPRALDHIPIPATEITYDLVNDDIGKFMSFEVTPLADSGTLTGAPAESAISGPVTAIPGAFVNDTSVSYPGVSGARYQVPVSADFNQITDISSFAWIKPSVASGPRCIASHTGPISGRKWMMFTDSGQFQTFISQFGGTSTGSTKNYLSVGASVNDGNWHHVGFTFTNQTLKLYIDGAEVTGGSLFKIADGTVTELHQSTHDLFLGANGIGTGSNSFLGLIDETSYWDKVLSGAEITELYNTGLAFDLATHSAASNLKEWWRGEGSTQPTLLGEFGNDGSASGAVDITTSDAVPTVAGGTPSNIEQLVQNTGGSFPSGFYSAQEFTTPGSDYTLNSVDVYLSTSAARTANVSVEIWGITGGGVPDVGNVIATSDLVDASTITGSTIAHNFNFSTPPVLDPSTQYAFVFKNTSSGLLFIARGNGNPYVDNDYGFASSPYTSWSMNGSEDMTFKIYGEI